MYTVDVNVDEPIMLINKQIGASYNEEGEFDGTPYIDGAGFQEELMWLDGQGKKRIHVYICSEGGSIMEAMKICSAILQTKTPVDTYNTGVCASSAGLIFMCGRKRYMNDYALFMAHPVSGGDEKSSQAFTDSISSVISSNSSLTQDMVRYMMSQTTWSGSSECLRNGICTDVIATKDTNKKYLPANNTKALLAYCNKLTEEIIDNLKTPTMELKTITNKLNLVEGSSLEAINNAIDVIVSGKSELQNTVNSLTDELAQAKANLETAQANVDKLQADVDAANAEKEAAAAQAAELEATNKATEMVNLYKVRLGNNAEAIAKYINLAKTNFDSAKELLEALPLNDKAPVIGATNTMATHAGSVEFKMQEIARKHNQL